MDKVAIYTSSWRVKLPADHARISVARSAPRGQSGFKCFRSLAPGSWFRSVSAIEYRRRYFDEILGPLDAETVVRDLLRMADGRVATLLCWETPQPGPEWCHRGFISQWLFDQLKLEVLEWGQEVHGFGAAHPKLPEEFRVASHSDPFR